MDIQRGPEKPLGVGAVFKQGLKGPGGGHIDGDYEIVENQPNQLIKFQVVTRPARPTGTNKFEAKGLGKLMDPMIASIMRSGVATFSNLKAYLEGHGK